MSTPLFNEILLPTVVPELYVMPASFDIGIPSMTNETPSDVVW